MSHSTCTYTGAISGFGNWLTSNYPQYTPSAAPSGAARVKRDDDDDDDDDDDGKKDDDDDHHYNIPSGPMGDSMATYPHLVKIEERRLPESTPPYCVQYQVLDDGTWNTVPDPDNNGQPKTVHLLEQDPGYSAYEAAGLANGKLRRRRDHVPDACHCQWFSGQ